MSDNPWYSRKWAITICWGLVLFAVISGVIGGLARGLHDEPDWRAFVKETSYVWEHLEIAPWTGMFGYLPAASFLLWPFTVWLPRPMGLIAFALTNGAAAVGGAWILFRWWFVDNAGVEGDRRSGISKLALFGWPLFVLGAHFQNVLQGNQLTIILLFLCVAGLTLIQLKRSWSGGFLLGVATCLKVTPGILLVFLLLKRRWSAVGGMVLAFLLLDMVPSAALFGIDGAIREHKAWLQRVEWYSNRRFIEDPWLRVMHHGHEHNTSLSVVLTRWLREQPGTGRHIVVRGDPSEAELKEIRAAMLPGDHLSIDPMPTSGERFSVSFHESDARRSLPRTSIANWSAERVYILWMLIEAAVLASAVLITLRSRRHADSRDAWQGQAALWLLVSMWSSPMLRDYYLPLALPAAVIAWRAVLAGRPSEKIGAASITAIAALVSCFVSVLCLASDTAEWYGVHFLALATLTIATMSICRRSERPDCPTQ